MKKFAISFAICLLSCICVIMTSCASEDKVYTKDQFSITLTSEYEKMGEDDYDTEKFVCVYQNYDKIVFVSKDSFTNYSEAGVDCTAYTAEDYAGIVAISNDLVDSYVESIDDLTLCTYTSEVDGVVYAYFAFYYIGSDAFWQVQFATLESSASEYRDEFISYAKTVVVE